MKACEVSRKTRETDVFVRFDPSGGGVSVSTGIGFFDHMLTAFGVHGGFGLTVKAKGDLQVDGHHTVEDVGLVLGSALGQALGGKEGLARYGHALIPMDEALALAVVDLSGRPYLKLDAPMPQQQIGAYDSCLTAEFLRAFAMNSGITLHVRTLSGENAHHMTEAIFKALAHALQDAMAPVGGGVLSSKGVL